ncbi:hypothetical protein Csa_003167 [Cucumis sativus]|uniref:Uncharacterized protein n=1 Tax=Cucumis sativus TaxID=3659 RepID=A0A0A0KHK5_CUCSA|nr:hypothetical protein Csa_003167 [Cucumis sativus]
MAIVLDGTDSGGDWELLRNFDCVECGALVSNSEVQLGSYFIYFIRVKGIDIPVERDVNKIRKGGLTK